VVAVLAPVMGLLHLGSLSIVVSCEDISRLQQRPMSTVTLTSVPYTWILYREILRRSQQEADPDAGPVAPHIPSVWWALADDPATFSGAPLRRCAINTWMLRSTGSTSRQYFRIA